MAHGIDVATSVVQYVGMSTKLDLDAVPPVTLGWRLRLSLEWAGVSVGEMARELEVSRQTMTRWLHDDGIPKRIYLDVWARRCGVNYNWLAQPPKAGEGEDGEAIPDNHSFVEMSRRFSQGALIVPIRGSDDPSRARHPYRSPHPDRLYRLPAAA